MSEASPGRRAVFLDRDGTLNVEKDYLFRPEEFEFILGAPQAVRRLKAAGFLVVVVTNQSGVARGFYGEAEVERLHRHVQQLLVPFDTSIDAFYFCPHHPVDGIGRYRVDCDCRKGRPGMLLQAAREHRIDLSRSYMIGDKPADIEAGTAAGCTPILVRTGYGAKVKVECSLQADDLPEAVELILQREIGCHDR